MRLNWAFRLVVPVLGLALLNPLPAGAIDVEMLPAMPEAVSNNAVAVLNVDGDPAILSLMGLATARTPAAIHNRAWAYSPRSGLWSPIPDVPGGAGRLAAVAATAGGAVWLFGGYTVSAGGEEVSTPGVYRWQGHGEWDSPTAMPVPVDDASAHVYRDRYIYLVSGWHDLGNVNLVQVLDTQNMQWSMATPWPGEPVFGHAGGMSDGRLVVCDGVRIEYPEDGRARRFMPSQECWMGQVDVQNYRRIAWRPVPAHPGPPRYRMAAGSDGQGRVVFAGGTDNPYNFNGMGYNGVPSEPLAAVLSFDLEKRHWVVEGDLPRPTMDHRGLPFMGGWFYLLGGMDPGQRVSSAALRFRLGGRRLE